MFSVGVTSAYRRASYPGERSEMPQQTYVFKAELVGFEGVRRTVTVATT